MVQLGTGITEFRHQIPAGSSTAVYTRRSDLTTGTYYATSDHLGSADLVMDSSANVLVRESFTPFGARRGSNWQTSTNTVPAPSPADWAAITKTTRQGFTGHEMLDSVGLIHMNGRVYDPTIGRFLSADSVIQSLGASQSINPYSYAWNDPLRYTDPSGHSLLGDIIGVVAMVVAIWLLQPELIPAILGGAGAGIGSITISTAIISGFVGGFVGTLVSTGSLSAALTAGLISGITAGLTAGVGQLAANQAWDAGEFVIARAAIGCASSAAASGNCGKGALSAAFALAAEPMIIKFPSFGVLGAVPESVEAGILGGEAARIAGGKFDDGFSTAAVQYLSTFKPSDSRAIGTPLHQLNRLVLGTVVDVYAAIVGQLGAVVAFAQDLTQTGTDLINGRFGAAAGDLWATVYDLAVPHYGYYGGAGWGTRQFPSGKPQPLNQQDYAAYVHDMGCSPACNGPADLQWVGNSYNGNPSYLPAGIIGSVYKVIGTIPFEIAGKFQ